MPDLSKPDLRAALLLYGLLTLLAGAASAAVPGPTPAPEPLRYCVVCHGVELNGNRAVDAPNMAGLPRWYIERQMRAFREGWRGTHREDVAGMEMRPQATVLEAQQVSRAAAFVASVPRRGAPATVSGNAARGERLYRTCAACHGTRGEGNESLLSPPLAGQSDWYLVTQLEHFRRGVRGGMPGDDQGALMRAAAVVLPDVQAVTDVVTYINTLHQPDQGDSSMHKTAAAAALAAGITGAAALPANAAEVTRYPLPGSDFPIAQAVEIPAGTTLVYHSGMTPAPADPQAERFSPAFWGDTEAQAMSVFGRLEESLKAKKLGFSDVVKMQVYLVAPPGGDAMDFNGFMNAYRRYFGSDDQPNLPARSAFEVAGLAAPGMLVEVEVVLARP